MNEDKFIKPTYVIILALFVALLWGFFSCDDWNTAFVLATAIIITWYTYETYQLRLMAQLSREASEMPVLTLHLDSSANPTLQIRNVGNVMAYDVKFLPFELHDHVHVFHMNQTDQYIEPGNMPALDLISYKKPDGNTRSHMSLGDVLHHMAIDGKILIVAHYKNPVGQTYHVIYSLYSFAAEKPALQFIRAGKGVISYEQAKDATKKTESHMHPSYEIFKYLGREVPDFSNHE